MFRNAEPEEDVVAPCDCCKTVPVSHLGLDLAVPLAGWDRALAERGIEVAPDDLGRPSVPRHVLGELLSEQRERKARLAEQAAQKVAAQQRVVPAGVPAVEGATPFESLAAAPGYVTARDEFGGGRTSAFQDLLDERLNEGRKAAAGRKAPRKAEEKR